jgi:pyridoxal phosphate enzyme (YggS family)
MNSVASNLLKVKSFLPEHVGLVAVSKFHPPEAILEAYNAGQRVFGESRQQEIEAKHKQLPKDIEWHFIGHLQTNKVKTILPYVHTIESVDSVRLLREIEKQGAALSVKVNCLLEVHIAREPEKYGFTMDECTAFLATGEWAEYNHLAIAGVMGMATYTDDKELISKEFQSLSDYFHQLKASFFAGQESFKEISMGMSNDYPIAIQEGSTLVRVGTSIFGEREY